MSLFNDTNDTKMVLSLFSVSRCLLKEVKRDLKRIHIDGCRYNERLNSKTEVSKRLGIYWVERVGMTWGGWVCTLCVCDIEERDRRVGAGVKSGVYYKSRKREL